MKQLVLSAVLGCLAWQVVLASGDDPDDAGINRHRMVQTDASRFAIHDAELRETMLRLNALVSYAEQPEAPLTKENRRFLQELLDTVGRIAESADYLKKQNRIDHLGDAQMQRYTDLAERLYEDAVSIEMNARTMQLEEMNDAFLDLNQTCIQCHRLFRSL